MTRLGLAMLAAALVWQAAGADAPPAPQPNLPIWPDGAAQGAPREQETRKGEERFVRNVAQASIDVWLPDPATASGMALVVCPGGAFRFLTMTAEGDGIARWLNARGIAAFVLHYRLKQTPRSDLLFFLRMLFELPPLLSGKALVSDPSSFAAYAPPAIADGAQALRFVRGQAARWRLDPQRIGIAGFSAGGVVALGASLSGEAQARPDFTAALYSGPLQLGKVPADAPPLYAAAAEDDPLTALATRPIAAAWKAGGAPVELHLYQHGGHGFKQGTDSDRWKDDFGAWLDAKRPYSAPDTGASGSGGEK